MSKSGLKYLKRDEIDDKKWDECVSNAENSRFYAQISHLDRVTDNWNALVYDDYDFVMPLPVKQKFGISYVYQPLFAQQLGIFPNPPEKVTTLFFREIIKKHSFAETQINAENKPYNFIKEINFTERQNFLLYLGPDYSVLQKYFSKNTRRNLVKAQNNKLNFVHGIRLEDFMEFKGKNLPEKISKKDIQRLKSIVAFGQYKGFGEIFGVYSPDNKLCAAVYFVRWKNRFIYMNAASDSEGKKLGGMYFLMENFIRMNAGKNMILDFEGSTIPGLARFYSGFGATPEKYFQLKINRLPLPLRWIKK